jgi:hypothetical protein
MSEKIIDLRGAVKERSGDGGTHQHQCWGFIEVDSDHTASEADLPGSVVL